MNSNSKTLLVLSSLACVLGGALWIWNVQSSLDESSKDQEISTSGKNVSKETQGIENEGEIVEADAAKWHAEPSRLRQVAGKAAPADHFLLSRSRGNTSEAPTSDELLKRARLSGRDSDALDLPTASLLDPLRTEDINYNDAELYFRGLQERRLTKSDLDPIFAFLENPPASLAEPRYHSIANDAIRALSQGGGLLYAEAFDRYEKLLLSPEADPVIADYLVQHLDFIHRDGPWRERAEKVLFEALSLKHGTLDGAALFVLDYARRDGRLQAPVSDLRRATIAVLSESGRSASSRNVAVAVAYENGWREAVVPVIEGLPKAGFAFPGKLAACRFILRYGNDDEQAALSDLIENSTDPMLQTAFRQSLSK